MKPVLLYVEEYRSKLSDSLRKRDDIDVIFIRPTLRFFDKSYLEESSGYYFPKELPYEENLIKFKNWLKENNYTHIDYMLNDSEYYMAFANRLARDFNVDALSEEQVEYVRDKVTMKDKFREIGLRTVDYKEVSSKEDVIKFFLDNGKRRIVFKPRREMNSYNVYMIDDMSDIDSLPVEITPDDYMVELYTDAHEWCIESLVQDGKVLDSYLTYIPTSTIEASINCGLNCHMQLLEYPSYFEISPKEYIQKIVDGMELKNGAMTIEIFITPDGKFYASELGWRFPGCQTTTNISISRGFNIFDTLIDISIHKPVKLEYKTPITVPGDIYLPNKEGTIEEFTSLEELSKLPGFVMGELFIKKGEYQEKRRVGTDASGWVIVESSSPEETMRLMENIYNNYQIKTKEERIGTHVKKLI